MSAQHVLELISVMKENVH